MKHAHSRFIWVLALSLMALTNICRASLVPATFENPVIKGDYSNPSITAYEDGFILAASNNEWYPAIPIFYSKDLINWKLVSHAMPAPPFESRTQIKSKVSLVVEQLVTKDNVFFILGNCINCGGKFIIQSTTPLSGWSEPAWLGDESTLDMAIFLDGKESYLLKVEGNVKNSSPGGRTVSVQKINLSNGKIYEDKILLKLNTSSKNISSPRMYKYKQRYLLILSEGNAARSKGLMAYSGPSLKSDFFAFENNPILTQRHLGRNANIHSTDRCELIRLDTGEWWGIVEGRKTFRGHQILGKEVFLVPVEFEENWPVFNPGVGQIRHVERRPNLPWTPLGALSKRDNFDDNLLGQNYIYSLSDKEDWKQINSGKLIVRQPHSFQTPNNPILIGKKIESAFFIAKTKLTTPNNKSNLTAGMALLFNDNHNFQLLKKNNSIELIENKNGKYRKLARSPYRPDSVIFKVEFNGYNAIFSFGEHEGKLKRIQKPLKIEYQKDEKTAKLYTGILVKKSNSARREKILIDWFEVSNY